MVAIYLKNSEIVLTCGLYPCGSMNDQKISNSGLCNHFAENELVVLNSGYSGRHILRSSMVHKEMM